MSSPYDDLTDDLFAEAEEREWKLKEKIRKLQDALRAVRRQLIEGDDTLVFDTIDAALPKPRKREGDSK